MNTFTKLILDKLKPLEQLLIVSSDSTQIGKIINGHFSSVQVTLIDFTDKQSLKALPGDTFEGVIFHNLHHWLKSPEDLDMIKPYLTPSAQCFATFFNYQYIGTIHDLVQKGAQDLFFKYEKNTSFPTTLSLIWSFFTFLRFSFQDISCLVSAEFEPLKQQLPCSYQRHQLKFELQDQFELLQLFSYAYLFDMTLSLERKAPQTYSELTYHCYPMQQMDFQGVHHGK